MSRRATVLLVAVLLSSPARVQAMSWSLGSNLGFGVIHGAASGNGTTTVTAWPANVISYQPALRVGIANSKHSREVVVDSGLLLLDEAGSTLSLFAGTLSYQATFRSSSTTAPFVNATVGFYSESAATHTSTSPSYGAGVGYRHIVGDRHGSVRAEIRVDHLTGDPSSGRPDLTTFGVRFGFDLWL